MAQDLQSRQKRAFELHAQIASAGKKVVESFLEIDLALKEIRDEKYYKELRYDSFESYIETVWNIPRSSMLSSEMAGFLLILINGFTKLRSKNGD